LDDKEGEEIGYVHAKLKQWNRNYLRNVAV